MLYRFFIWQKKWYSDIGYNLMLVTSSICWCRRIELTIQHEIRHLTNNRCFYSIKVIFRILSVLFGVYLAILVLRSFQFVFCCGHDALSKLIIGILKLAIKMNQSLSFLFWPIFDPSELIHNFFSVENSKIGWPTTSIYLGHSSKFWNFSSSGSLSVISSRAEFLKHACANETTAIKTKHWRNLVI